MFLPIKHFVYTGHTWTRNAQCCLPYIVVFTFANCLILFGPLFLLFWQIAFLFAYNIGLCCTSCVMIGKINLVLFQGAYSQWFLLQKTFLDHLIPTILGVAIPFRQLQCPKLIVVTSMHLKLHSTSFQSPSPWNYLISSHIVCMPQPLSPIHYQFFLGAFVFMHHIESCWKEWPCIGFLQQSLHHR